MGPHPDRPAAATGFDIVGLAASAGGVHALEEVLKALPRTFPVPVVVVQHLDPRHRSLIADILDRRSPLMVKEAEAGERVRPGVVYTAPPNHHLLLSTDGVIELTETELVHFVRPSADLLFESIAATYRERAVAVVLSGSGTDGAMGAMAVRQMGGTVIAQDRAEFPGMPQAAIDAGAVDFVLSLADIPGALEALVGAAGRIDRPARGT
jgi:two-component system, chemotaxis family, protein-glutamate methylesterase/glutaminase